MTTTAALETVARFTRYNSGTHMLDSGGDNGRAWQQPLPESMFTPAGDDWFGISVSLTHILAKHWDIDEDLQALIDSVWDGEAPVQISEVDTSALDRVAADLPDLMSHVVVVGGDLEECTHDVTVDPEGLEFFDVATLVMTLRGYVREARDNSYNHENDLDQVFIWECWVPAHEEGGDWVWVDDAVLVVYAHTGADVRGGYARPMALETGRYDVNMIETRVGWYPADDATLEITDDLGNTDEFSVGYHSSPTYHLESEMGEFVRWEQDNGHPIAVFLHPSDKEVELRFAPEYNL